MKKHAPLKPLFFAVLGTLPGICLRLFHPEIAPQYYALLCGAAILCASFILLWACDVAQSEIPQALALAVVALIAVLPEYAVDMYFTWQAGRHPESGYASYAIANMTGANRLLIGVAWSLIAAIYWFKYRKAVELDDDRSLEIRFLALATLYALLIPIKGSLTWYDGIVFISIYVFYIIQAGKRPCVEEELHGPAAYIDLLPRNQKLLAAFAMFAYSALTILADAELFSEGLVQTGKHFGVNEFLLVQWLAPIASEAPEFIVAIMMVSRGNAGTALGSLLSAKVNQWSLLVGMIPGVYGLAAGTFSHPIPMNGMQMDEILLTAAQSLFAVAILADLTLKPYEAILLFGLFIGQFLLPPLAAALPFGDALTAANAHHYFSFIYFALCAVLFATRPSQLKCLASTCTLGRK